LRRSLRSAAGEGQRSGQHGSERGDLDFVDHTHRLPVYRSQADVATQDDVGTLAAADGAKA
jgi:hypothetical protein